MAPSLILQRRTHNLLLIQKLLNLRDGASPFTLLLDSLEQSAQPVVKEFILRVKVVKTKIVFVSFQTLRKPKYADIFIAGRKKSLSALRQEIASHIPPSQPNAQGLRTILIIDSLHPLATTSPSQLANFLSSLLSPTTSLLATYHTDVPIPPSVSSSASTPYSPDPLTTLTYLATSILRISSLSHAIEKKKARDRSLQEPIFGLEEGREGVLVGLRKPIEEGMDGVVLEMELRRKSGRGVREVFVLFTSAPKTVPTSGPSREGIGGKICLLDDHPLYAPPVTSDLEARDSIGGEDEVETTFSLGLTEKQRRDREGVVLPYFDAQRGDGSGEGGRILYDMDRGDDFDEEEDEI